MPITIKALKPKESDFEPQTLGEHIKRCRLIRNLNQKEAARQLGVTSFTVLNWEKGHTEPPIESMPSILQFLTYDPYPPPKTLPERMLAKRRSLGWSIQEAARQFGVEQGTWGGWERGETILFRKHRDLVARWLELPAEEIHREMSDRWNRSHRRAPIGKT